MPLKKFVIFLTLPIKPSTPSRIKTIKKIIRAMKEEDILKKKCGTENPFKVPEGYFEQFTANLMNQLPEKPEEKKRKISSLNLWRVRIVSYAAAACVCGVMLFGVSSYLKHQQKEIKLNPTQQQYNEQYASSEDEYINDALDYALVSNQEIASYLTDIY